MKARPTRRRRRPPPFAALALGALLAGVVPATPGAASVELEVQTIAGGSTTGAGNGGWALAGTAAQPATTEGSAPGGWTLEGGYWPLAARRSDVLFRDGFEP